MNFYKVERLPYVPIRIHLLLYQTFHAGDWLASEWNEDHIPASLNLQRFQDIILQIFVIVNS